MAIYGGKDQQRVFDDFWVLDTDTRVWNAINCEPSLPPRFGCVALLVKQPPPSATQTGSPSSTPGPHPAKPPPSVPERARASTIDDLSPAEAEDEMLRRSRAKAPPPVLQDPAAAPAGQANVPGTDQDEMPTAANADVQGATQEMGKEQDSESDVESEIDGGEKWMGLGEDRHLPPNNRFYGGIITHAGPHWALEDTHPPAPGTPSSQAALWHVPTVPRCKARKQRVGIFRTCGEPYGRHALLVGRSTIQRFATAATRMSTKRRTKGCPRQRGSSWHAGGKDPQSDSHSLVQRWE